MAENNIELIAANDLPTTEAEEVSVLCIDNGELKQKPGASFGGGGGYVVVADVFDFDNATGVVNESYDNFVGILLAGGSVWINVGATMGVTMFLQAIAWSYMDGGFVLMAQVGADSVNFACPNGTWTPEG